MHPDFPYEIKQKIQSLWAWVADNCSIFSLQSHWYKVQQSHSRTQFSSYDQDFRKRKSWGERITFVPSQGMFSQSGLLDWVLLQVLGSCSVWLQQKCLLQTLWTFHMLRARSELGIWTPQLDLSVMGCNETVKPSTTEAHLIVEFRPISGSKLQSEFQLCTFYCSFVGTLWNMWHLPDIQKGVDFVYLTKTDCVHLTLLS